MKTSRARLQGIATAAIVLLLMLSATARAESTSTITSTSTSEADETDDQCVATTTTTGAATTTTTTAATTTSESSQTEEQSGVVGTSTENQAGEDEPCGTNNQVGPNEEQGDNVNVVELGQGEQNQIQDAQADHTIAGEVQVNDDGSVSSSVSDSGVSLSPSEGANGRLDVQVSGTNVAGPKSFLISLSNAQDPTTHTLAVILDGQLVAQASSIGQVLHPSSNGASYIVVKSNSGYKLLVSIPHFSTHQLSIVPLGLGPAQGFFSISTVFLAAAILAITAIFGVVFASRKRIYTLLV